MQQTFLFIHENWLNPLLGIWSLIALITLGVMAARRGVAQDFWSTLSFFVVGGVIIKFVVPFVMVEDPVDGEGRVLAIRGYGFFLLVGVLAGVGLAMHRSRQLGLNPDITLNLCFVLFATGILGARVFYVIQYWPEFQEGGSVSIRRIVNMTEGGLVVYGSIIGGVVGGILFLRTQKLPVLAVLDILAPCMMIGLSIGRIGCLMNGCCWGGVCDTQPSIQFPEGSPPYARHVETGELFGMKAPPLKEENDSGRKISVVHSGSPAETAGIRAGDEIMAFDYSPNPNDARLPEEIVYLIRRGNGDKKIVFDDDEIPSVSLPVHPVQIYSSVNAFFVFLFLWFYFPSRKRDGQVLGLLMIIYPIGRFLLEIIRSDELGQFGTQLTISQLTSIASILGGIFLLVFGYYRLKRTETLEMREFDAKKG